MTFLTATNGDLERRLAADAREEASGQLVALRSEVRAALASSIKQPALPALGQMLPEKPSLPPWGTLVNRRPLWAHCCAVVVLSCWPCYGFSQYSTYDDVQ